MPSCGSCAPEILVVVGQANMEECLNILVLMPFSCMPRISDGGMSLHLAHPGPKCLGRPESTVFEGLCIVTPKACNRWAGYHKVPEPQQGGSLA